MERDDEHGRSIEEDVDEQATHDPPTDASDVEGRRSAEREKDSGSKSDPIAKRPLTTSEQQESGTAAGPETS